MVKCLPTMWETQVRSLGREDLLEKKMATHSSILAWKIQAPQSMGLQINKICFNYFCLLNCVSTDHFKTPGFKVKPGGKFRCRV